MYAVAVLDTLARALTATVQAKLLWLMESVADGDKSPSCSVADVKPFSQSTRNKIYFSFIHTPFTNVHAMIDSSLRTTIYA